MSPTTEPLVPSTVSSDRQKAIDHWRFSPEDNVVEPLGDDFVQLKVDILNQYGVHNIKEAWLSVTAAIEDEAALIQKKGQSAWPVVTFDEVTRGVSEEKLSEIKRSGLVVIRNVLPEKEARHWHEELVGYLEDNPEVLPGIPVENPWIYRSYFSPVQNKVHSHPNTLAAHRFLNNIWHGYSREYAQPEPLAYADALRYRKPGDFSPVLAPHIDAGSLDRWADDKYRDFYRHIFQGDVSNHDAFDIEARIKVNTAKFPGPHQSTVLRTFQGWTALSPSGGGFGQSALAVFPNVTLGIAYTLLRPFFRPPADGSLDPKLWELDISDAFQGAAKGLSQAVRPETHPHLRLDQTLVVTPRVEPGDLVFWHPDVIHAVDPVLRAGEPATVLYIPSVPLTEQNHSYIKAQKVALLDQGKTPPDFERWGVSYEGKAKGWLAAEGFIHPAARFAFGLEETLKS